MSQGDYTYYSDIGDIVESLREVYQKHSMDFPTAVDQAKNQIYPMSSEIMAIYNAFQQAYQNSKLSSATKWTIQNGELSEGALLKAVTLDNALTSLASLESFESCSRVQNTNTQTCTQTAYTNQTTYAQVTYSTAGTTYSETFHTAETTYTQFDCYYTGNPCTVNEMRNSSHGGDFRNDNKIYLSDCAETAHLYGVTCDEAYYGDGATYSYSSNKAGVTYTRTMYTAGVDYTEEV